jgi:peptidyl-prolyl cis-trans isomerase D
MLKILRVHATSWIIKIILGAIVIVFVFWGVGSWKSQKAMRVAVVNEEVITLDAYREAYNNILEQLKRQFGNRLTDEMLEMFQVEKQALETVISETLLLQEAKKLDLRVSSKELADAIKKITAFQRAGIFDNRLYQRILSLNRIAPEEFEKAQKDGMLVDKVRSLIIGSVKVSDEEARQWYDWNQTAVDIDYVLFDPEKYKDIKPSDKDLKDYFEGHKDDYKTEPKVKVRYIRFDPDAYKSKVEISQEEVKEYFDTHPDEFKTSKTVEARHILLKTEPKSAPEDVEKRRKEARDIMVMAKGGKDFAELAKQYSEGPTKDNGGYLGVFDRKAMVKPFADKAFSMKAGEISEPLKTRFGWHIIKVEKINEASTKSFEEVSTKIRDKLIDGRAMNLAYDAAEAAYDDSYDTDDLAKISEAYQFELHTTDFFTEQGPEKGFKDRAAFASAAFSLSPSEISDVKDFGDGYYMLQVVEKQPEKIPAYEKVRVRVGIDLVKVKQEAQAKKDAEALLALLKEGADTGAEAKEDHPEFVSTGFFKRQDAIPKIGYVTDISKTVFQLSPEKPMPDQVVKGQKGFYVIKLRARKAPDSEGFEKEKENLKESLLRQKQNSIFGEWLSQLRDQSDITIEDEFK